MALYKYNLYKVKVNLNTTVFTNMLAGHIHKSESATST